MFSAPDRLGSLPVLTQDLLPATWALHAPRICPGTSRDSLIGLPVASRMTEPSLNVSIVVLGNASSMLAAGPARGVSPPGSVCASLSVTCAFGNKATPPVASTVAAGLGLCASAVQSSFSPFSSSGRQGDEGESMSPMPLSLLKTSYRNSISTLYHSTCIPPHFEQRQPPLRRPLSCLLFSVRRHILQSHNSLISLFIGRPALKGAMGSGSVKSLQSASPR